jgi:hypothetical protein
MLEKYTGSLGTDARGRRAMTKLHFRNVLFDSLSRFEKNPRQAAPLRTLCCSHFQKKRTLFLFFS